MNTQIKQKTNSFDTINLTIPGDVINRNTSNYFSNLKVNEETEELMLENHGDCQQIKFNRDKKKHLGLGHCIYVPHRNIYDISISAKILREKYPIGITKETIYDVIKALENYGIGDIEPEAFIEQGEIRTLDNTFNIKIDDFQNTKSIYDMFDALSLVAISGAKGKMKTYDADGSEFGEINGVVFGKDTRKNQSITFYYKPDEAFSQRGDKRENHKEVIMRKYGMDSREFFSAFDNTIRAELRLTSQDLMKNSFNLPRKRNSNVVLRDILNSKTNAMLYKFNDYVNERQTELGMKRIIDKQLKVELYKVNGYGKKMDLSLRLWGGHLNDVIEMTNGDKKKVCDYASKVFYDGVSLNTDMRRKVNVLIQIWKQKDKSNLEIMDYIGKYKEITKKIKHLV